MRRSLIVIGIGTALAVSGGIGVATTSDPSTAPITATITRVVPNSGQDLTATITSLQDTLRRVPGDYVSWANLAVAYVEQARVTGLFSYYDKADKAAAQSFSIEPDDNFSALAARAAIEAARHDFSQALASCSEGPGHQLARPRSPRHPRRRAERARQVRRPAAGGETADRLQPSTPIAARYSYAYELRGDLDRAGDILRRAAASGARADKSYILTLRADILRKQDRLAGCRIATWRPRCRPCPATCRPSSPRPDCRRRAATSRVPCRPGRTWSRNNPCPNTSPSSVSSSTTSAGPEEADAQFAVVRATIKLLEASGVDADLETALFEADHGSAEQALAAGPRGMGAPYERPRRRCPRLGPAPHRPRRGGAPDRSRGDPARLPGGQVLDPPRHHRGGARE